MPEFIPIDKTEKEKQEGVEVEDKVLASKVLQAKYAKELQDLDTQRIESHRQAVFAQNEIKDSEDLQLKIKELVEQSAKLALDRAEWERLKATQKAEIERVKIAQDNRENELNNREKQLDIRETLVAEREQLVADLEHSLNAENLKRIEKEREDNELINRLKGGGYKQFNSLISDCLDVLYKYGEKKMVYRAEDRLDEMWKWAKNGLPEHFDELVQSMKDLVDRVNRKAVEMARQPKVYPTKSWNNIVDSLEVIIKLFPEIKPAKWVDNPEGDVID
ncbi:MAG: hypothetical protein PHQ86_04730 [Dehalococcoidales bacterium]|jgi:hypothetical protein|nr:hypothetical protein [Dehalococcoidales bacterium]